MVCTADDLLGWKDFPKGLRVLLLDEDNTSVAEIKSKLEEMDYIVSTFCNENEALMAISSKPESFHVAIVEVGTCGSDGCTKFLETVKDLPTIMTSNIQCLSTMMNCIALGAAEFLQKPLSEDKLRNIWQHVVHKAFNNGGSVVSKSLKPIKDTMVSITNEAENENLLETEDLGHPHKWDCEQSTVGDKFPAPSTPQLKQGCRLLDDGDCQDQPNCSMEKERGDLEEESKSVDTTCNNSVAETICNSSVTEISDKVDQSSIAREAVTREDPIGGSNCGSNLSCKDSTMDSNIDIGIPKKAPSLHPISCGNKASRKKMKIDWTPELHEQFVKAVEQLGVDQAIPSRILELMKVEGLTRHNVASHLQKYRMHRRHILPKEEDCRWQHPRDPMQRVYAQKPIMAYPTYRPNHGFQTNQCYPVWGHPSTHPPGVQMWGHSGFPTWHHPDIWPWKTHPGLQVDAWGCPVPSQGPCSNFPQVQNASAYQNFQPTEDWSNTSHGSIDFHPDEEVIDKVVKEAITKPWLPLPLGLKPPSTESVLFELQRQGISNIPPHGQC